MRRFSVCGLAAIVLLFGVCGLAGQEADSAAAFEATAFIDAHARSLLEAARDRRDRLDGSIAAYSTTVTERISVRFRALWRDRLLFRRELAMRLHWSRDGASRAEVLGARQVTPVASTEIEVPDIGDLTGSAGDLLFRPGRERLLVGLDDGDAMRHPLVEGSEADYRFETGDTMNIRLPSGRTVRLVELRVHPRRNDFDLVAASFWLDADDHHLARAIYRPARPFELVRDLSKVDNDPDADDVERIPGFLRPIRAEAKRIVVEYGYWDLKWWLPRLVSVEVSASMGDFLHVPATFERRYAGYEVTAASPTDTARVAADAAAADPGEQCFEERDSTFVPEPLRPLGEGEQWDCHCEEDDVCELYVVAPLPDADSLLSSPLLPASPFTEGGALVTEAELDDFGRAIASLSRSEDRWETPDLELDWGLGAPGLVRYNRVEGFSLGATLHAAAGRAAADLTARLGTADLEPNAELGIESAYYAAAVRFAAYRRLAAANHGRGAFGFGNSVFAFGFGLDDGDYYRTFGAELVRPSGAEPSAIEWRIFAERQSSAEKETDFSLRRVFDDGHAFRENFRAEPADQAGLALTLRYSRGLNAAGFRGGGWTRLLGSTGTYDFARGSAGLWATVPLPGRFVAALEAEAGGTVGEPSVQALWRLGGPASLRGYGGSAAVGETFWRARVELANDLPAARIALFGDLAWAGPRDAWGTGRPLRAVGVGAGFLDGIVRLDLARALDSAEGWRFAIYLGGLL